MAKRKKKARVEDYRHDEKRKNNPPIGMVSYESKISEPKMKHYAYDPYLSPQLVWEVKCDEYGNRRALLVMPCRFRRSKRFMRQIRAVWAAQLQRGHHNDTEVQIFTATEAHVIVCNCAVTSDWRR